MRPSCPVVGLCWGHYEASAEATMRPLLRPLCWGHTVGHSLPRLGLLHPPHQYGLLSSAPPWQKSSVNFLFLNLTLCDMLMWQMCHSVWQNVSHFDREAISAWQASGQKERCTSTDVHRSENKLENTGIFVFSRVCPCVCSKQTNKHGLSSLSGKQRFQDLVSTFQSNCRERLEFSISLHSPV